MYPKELIQKLYLEYKTQYTEVFDSPFEFKKESNTKYIVVKNGKEIAYFLFRTMYDVNNSPINYSKHKIRTYWDVSWYWQPHLSSEEKNSNNFIKITATSFKIVDDFIRQNNPMMIGFSGQTLSHDRIYSNDSFLDKWKIIFGEKYNIEPKNDKIWIYNKILKDIDEHKIIRLSELLEIHPDKAHHLIKYPSKHTTKGISRFELIKEQIKRIILKKLYL
jgi:hypothetical protein